MKKLSPKSPSPRIPAAARKAGIIRSAAEIFGEKGFSGTKTREIAARAGVSEALIFKRRAEMHPVWTTQSLDGKLINGNSIRRSQIFHATLDDRMRPPN